MSNTIIITSTNESEARKSARENLVKAMAAMDKIDNTSSTATAAAAAEASETMNKALGAYSSVVQDELYAVIASAENPILELCKRITWDTPCIRRKAKDGVVSRSHTTTKTRLNLLSFIAYARKTKDDDTLYANIEEALANFAYTLEQMVNKEISAKDEKAVSIKDCRDSLAAVMVELGQNYAQSKDVRFIAYAATKASRANLGQLAELTADSVAPYIMDALHIRAENIGYSFEKANK